MQTKRRSAIKKLLASATALAGFGFAAKAKNIAGAEKQAGNVTTFQDVPLFSGHTKHGDIVYIAGKGAHRNCFAGIGKGVDKSRLFHGKGAKG